MIQAGSGQKVKCQRGLTFLDQAFPQV